MVSDKANPRLLQEFRPQVLGRLMRIHAIIRLIAHLVHHGGQEHLVFVVLNMQAAMGSAAASVFVEDIRDVAERPKGERWSMSHSRLPSLRCEHVTKTSIIAPVQGMLVSCRRRQLA